MSSFIKRNRNAINIITKELKKQIAYIINDTKGQFSAPCLKIDIKDEASGENMEFYASPRFTVSRGDLRMYESNRWVFIGFPYIASYVPYDETDFWSDLSKFGHLYNNFSDLEGFGYVVQQSYNKYVTVSGKENEVKKIYHKICDELDYIFSGAEELVIKEGEFKGCKDRNILPFIMIDKSSQNSALTISILKSSWERRSSASRYSESFDTIIKRDGIASFMKDVVKEISFNEFMDYQGDQVYNNKPVRLTHLFWT